MSGFPAAALSAEALLSRLGRLLAARPRRIAFGFAALLAASSLYGAGVAEQLQAGGIDVPGSESEEAGRLLEQHLGIGTPDLIAVLHRPEGDVRTAAYATRVLDGLDRLYLHPAIAGVVSHYDTGLASLVSQDGHRTLLLVDLEGRPAEQMAVLPEVEALLHELFPGVEIGGPTPASALAQEIAGKDVLRAELHALPIAGVLTLIFFRSAVAALLPILIGGFALAGTAAGTRLAANLMDVSIFSMNVGAFLGLGLSIDYALLIVQRFREELPRAASVPDAVAATLETAGHAVLVSGLTVMLSLAVLFVVPVPMLGSIGLGGNLAVASALFGALVLLPALLAWLGPRVNRLRVGRARGLSGPSPLWAAIARLSMRHPVSTACACALALLALGAPALRMQAVMPDARTFPGDTEVRRVEERLANPLEFDPSGASSIQIALRTPGLATDPRNLRAIQDYLERLRGVAGLREVRTPLGSLDPDVRSELELARAASEPELELQLARSVRGDFALVSALGSHPWRSREAAATVMEIREIPHPGLEVLVGGPTAIMVDEKNTVARYAGWVALLVVGLNLVVLFAAFRSVLVPVKAAIMNLLSLGASYGVLVLVFQDGHFSELLGFQSPGGLEPTIPLVLAAIVFGLSMDYEIFLLSRIQEEYLKHGDNHRSIVAGVSHTGRIISSAALILLVVIGAFAAGTLIFVKEIGVGMAAAIALDVTLVRALLVPATMHLLGDWNWWAPRWLGGGRVPAPVRHAAPDAAPGGVLAEPGSS